VSRFIGKGGIKKRKSLSNRGFFFVIGMDFRNIKASIETSKRRQTGACPPFGGSVSLSYAGRSVSLREYFPHAPRNVFKSPTLKSLPRISGIKKKKNTAPKSSRNKFGTGSEGDLKNAVMIFLYCKKKLTEPNGLHIPFRGLGPIVFKSPSLKSLPSTHETSKR